MYLESIEIPMVASYDVETKYPRTISNASIAQTDQS